MRNNCIFSGEIVVTVEVCVIRCLLCSFKAKNKKCFDLKMFSFNHCSYINLNIFMLWTPYDLGS